jgi:hypothetical protein
MQNKPRLEYEYLEEQKVENITRPVQAHRVRIESHSAVCEISRMLELSQEPSIAVPPFVNMETLVSFKGLYPSFVRTGDLS